MRSIRWIRFFLAMGLVLCFGSMGCHTGSSSPVPAGLVYSTNPAVYTEGVAIALNTPTSIGGLLTSYSVSPALPAGLSLDPVTGVISGTPTVAAATANYTVTGSDQAGSTTAILSITVVAPPLGITGTVAVPSGSVSPTVVARSAPIRNRMGTASVNTTAPNTPPWGRG